MSNGRFWIGTIPRDSWAVPTELPPLCVWLRGQREVGESGYDHFQVLAGFCRNVRLSQVKSSLGSPSGHWELTRSAAADVYVWKEATRVPGTQFELGTKPIRRNVSKDWDAVLSNAKSGNLDAIPADILVRCYSQITRIAKDNLSPVAVVRECFCFWGKTGTGKSRRAWDEAGLLAYPKDPSTKWWDGYRGNAEVIIDEFRGRIAIEHILRWLDRYPVLIETKGGATVLNATRIWLTSNVDPRLWYPESNIESVEALLRRLNITHFNYVSVFPVIAGF